MAFSAALCFLFSVFLTFLTLSDAVPQTIPVSTSSSMNGPVSEGPTTLPTNVVTSTSSVIISTKSFVSRTPAPALPRANLDSVATYYNGPLDLVISKSGGNQSSDLLYGLAIEDIDHAIDGGLYAELIQNRAFQQGNLNSWFPIGGASIELATTNPVSSALPQYLEMNVNTPGMGFENTGFWGFYVAPQNYQVSIWAKSSVATAINVKIALVSAANRTEWASSTIVINNQQWHNYSTVITPAAAAPDNNNVFVVTVQSSVVATLDFAYLSLFPPTFKNRPNGVRADLAQNFADLNPTWCRVLGGNNLEGASISDRLIWNNTIGPLINRVGRMGDWGYYNTNGMGLLELMQFCEDIGTEWLLAVYAGYSLGNNSVPQADLGPYIDAAIAEIEYLVGSPTSTYGSLRARDGHPDPFPLKYVEIGNEDFFSNTYSYRFPAFYNALSAAYPNITFVATTAYAINFPAGVYWDQHYYGNPEQFQGLFNAYDNFPRNNGTDIILTEYSVQQYEDLSYSTYPFVEGTVSEAVFGFGIERNSDVVLSQMWAPPLSNVHYNQVNRPRLITFDANPSSTILSTSYYMVQMLSRSHGRGFQTLPITANINTHPLYWTASLDPSSQTIYVKLANAGNISQSVALGGADFAPATASGTVLYGAQNSSNTPANPKLIVPQSLNVQLSGNGTVSFQLPPWSVAVITLQSQGGVWPTPHPNPPWQSSQAWPTYHSTQSWPTHPSTQSWPTYHSTQSYPSQSHPTQFSSTQYPWSQSHSGPYSSTQHWSRRDQ